MDRRNNRRDAEGSSVITANRLLDGRIVWLAADGQWSPHIRNAHVYSNVEIEDALKKQTASAQDNELVGVYGVQVSLSPTGPVPVTSRECIRAGGPSVHPDFTPEWQERPAVSPA
ncbi:DUF2849 domain-containing protein [Acetobacter tropicalis]|jgi:hypothetical protein|uniref:DUF2849 domain-containing protein n=1 Tax=Acetobacter tropicalis TaxID=104102 RepID=A0A094YH40_9PROT|nr:DUF2849 domain-containing protein [Acetobacter tropicalis]KAA8389540.1 DUF2849 domain-containing protein [Acetobacter tropicalis]KAA8390539.1 DUF2849 domain-containing protein [Acetobacter tropicalis]KGB21335.1 hypothetical protein AtDm6_2971 [Acetobacter tropicalis]MBC9008537.1 DUF2849 domain-containing protein [Acetobacter tropicalis]MDO8170232.1 DUF2849 domain-containing protein [Acetobacter tropicalis]